MNLSRKWLEEFVHVDASDKEFAEAMTLSGSKVELTHDLGAEIQNVVVGKVLSMEHHPDSDHMTGLLEVLETLPTKGLYLSDYAFAENEQTDLLKEMVVKYNIPLYTIKTGDSSLGDTFLCLYPTGASAGTGEENQGSMVLRYSYGDTKVLFTGDITAEEEQQLLEQNISADVLKVAHHGSKYSSDAAFLEKVLPKAAVISCGTNNVYGHPHKEAMERLQKTGAEIFRTDEDGTILVTIGKDGAMNIETMTERKPLYENIKEKLEKS